MLIVMVVVLLIQQMLWKKEELNVWVLQSASGILGNTTLKCCMTKGRKQCSKDWSLWSFFSPLKRHFYDFFFFCKHAIYKISLCFQEQQITLKHFHCKHLLLSYKEVKNKMQIHVSWHCLYSTLLYNKKEHKYRYQWFQVYNINNWHNRYLRLLTDYIH